VPDRYLAVAPGLLRFVVIVVQRIRKQILMAVRGLTPADLLLLRRSLRLGVSIYCVDSESWRVRLSKRTFSNS